MTTTTTTKHVFIFYMINRIIIIINDVYYIHVDHWKINIGWIQKKNEKKSSMNKQSWRKSQKINTGSNMCVNITTDLIYEKKIWFGQFWRIFIYIEIMSVHTLYDKKKYKSRTYSMNEFHRFIHCIRLADY